MKVQQKVFAAASALVLIASALAPAAFAQYGYGYGHRYGNNWRNDYRWNRNYHPYAKGALVGGGAGAIIGGLVGPEGYKGESAVKGGLLGAGAGLGYQYLRRRGTW
jgi:hypothetical protein